MSPMPQSLPNPTLDDVRRALALEDFNHEEAWWEMAPRARPMHRPPILPGESRTAAVLLLLYPVHGVLTFTLTRRSESVGSHKGQVSLPGGAQESGDRSAADTALRETCEELDVCRDDIHLLGSLTPLYVSVSDFTIHPYVGTLDKRPSITPDPVEVAEVLEMTLIDLLDDSIKVEERWELHGHALDVPFYQVDGHTVWGATAIMLSELEGRLRQVLGLHR